MKIPEPRQSKRRPSAFSRVVLWLFLLLVLGAIVFGVLGFYAYQEYNLPGPLKDKKTVTIGKGIGTPEIAVVLQENGVISDARVFSAMAYVKGTVGRLKAGEYEFDAASSMGDVMAKIAGGKSIAYKLSVPEGWTSEMTVARVNANDILEGDPVPVPPEGAIMPDTYVFRRGMTKQKLVEDMRAAQDDLLTGLWEKRNPAIGLASKEEALTLASIVEKETGVAAERPVIASVFMNRLKKGMRLQSDPTIIYGIAGGKGKLDRALTRADIDAPTPYNTYRIDGLPPGPIANPGRAALEAVLNPPETPYFYFVANGTGGHAFAATLEEHNGNVKKWRQIAGNAAAAAAAEAETPEATPEQPATATTPPAAVAPSETLDPPKPALPEPAVPEAAAPVTEAAKPPETPAPEAAPETVAPPPAEPDLPLLKLKPGTVVEVAGKLTAIPKRRPRR